MLKITYLFHSGFAIETSGSILIFDYWMDPSHAVATLLQSPKPFYVFASHFHEDHFAPAILEWRKTRGHITYLMSKDILRHRRAQKEDADVWLAKGGSWTDGTLSVHATGSTDSGVSWVVETEGLRLFHAGDLNNWYARFLPNASPGEIIHSEEMDEDVDPIQHEKRYLGELKDIRKLGHRFDVVMFPVDGRIGNGYTLGGRQFLERFDVGLFVPMHFAGSGFESAWRFREFAQARKVSFWEIQAEGDVIHVSHGGHRIIRPALLPSDGEAIMNLFAAARGIMVHSGNTQQWNNGYPNLQVVASDIERSGAYLIADDNRPTGYFAFLPSPDPTYRLIYEGHWRDDSLPYCVIHRIASLPEAHGIFSTIIKFALTLCPNLRMDTHRDNLIMQHLLKQHGFSYCGIIHLASGDERLAYQLLAPPASRAEGQGETS